MKYSNETRRRVLEKFKNGYKNGKSDEEIISMIEDLQGTEDEKRQLYEDCKEYVKLKNLRNDVETKDNLIEEAEKYFEEKPNSILIKEALATFYIERIKGIVEEKEIGDKKELKIKTLKLIGELNKEEPNNLKTASKLLSILVITGDYENALQLTKIIDKIPGGKEDGIIFGQTLSLYRKIGESNDREKTKKIFGKDTNWALETSRIVKDRIDNVEFGKTVEKKNRAIDTLTYAAKTLRDETKNCTISEFRTYRNAIDKIWDKVEKGRREIRELGKPKIDRDEETAKKIDLAISYEREVKTAEEMLKVSENIEDRILRLIQQCQIQQAYGVDAKSTLIGLEGFSTKNKVSMSKEEKIQIIALKNYLLSKQAKVYNHKSWVELKANYIKKTKKKDIKYPNKPNNESLLQN